MSKTFDFLKKKPVEMNYDEGFSSQQQYKTRFCMVGTPMSGKSTIAAATVLTAETMSAILGNFYCRVLPQSSHIMADANNLRLGRFPEKTDPYLVRPPEAGLLICDKGWREKKVQVPLCDVGGEVFDAMTLRNMGSYDVQERIKNINRRVLDYVRDSQGFVVALSAPDALMFRTDYKALDADVYVYNVLSQVMDYKRQTGTNIDGIAVWLTKWDEAKDLSQDTGINIYDDQNGLAKFFDNGYPGISMLLKPLVKQGKVRFFRSYFTIKKRDDGVTDEYWDNNPNAKRIDILEDLSAHIQRRPKYCEEDYVSFIRFMGSFAKG